MIVKLIFCESISRNEEKHEEKIKIDDKIKNCLHILSSRVDGIFVEKERL